MNGMNPVGSQVVRKTGAYPAGNAAVGRCVGVVSLFLLLKGGICETRRGVPCSDGFLPELVLKDVTDGFQSKEER